MLMLMLLHILISTHVYLRVLAHVLALVLVFVVAGLVHGRTLGSYYYLVIYGDIYAYRYPREIYWDSSGGRERREEKDVRSLACVL